MTTSLVFFFCVSPSLSFSLSFSLCLLLCLSDNWYVSRHLSFPWRLYFGYLCWLLRVASVGSGLEGWWMVDDYLPRLHFSFFSLSLALSKRSGRNATCRQCRQSRTLARNAFLVSSGVISQISPMHILGKVSVDTEVQSHCELMDCKHRIINASQAMKHSKLPTKTSGEPKSSQWVKFSGCSS